MLVWEKREDARMTFGQVLAEERRASRVSQHGLALAVETTQRHLSFLETGRSRPTREMILRLSDALDLPPGRRADLFEAAGYMSPYKRRPADDAAVVEVLLSLEKYILAPWPYPALALTETWDVLAANTPGRKLFGLEPIVPGTQPPNLFERMLDPTFRVGIANWRDVGAIVHARLRRHALEHAEFRERLDRAVAEGAFTGVMRPFVESEEIPVILPLVFALPNGLSFRMTSMTARLTSAHDDLVSGLEIELCVPLDDASEVILRG
jgi:transcriptional regulator with XRE-family HTH domain